MVKKILFLLAAASLGLVPAHAATVPPAISYQGKLLQPSGVSVPDSTVSVTFSIYDVPTGGTPLWTETNTSVAVKGGLFSVLLGNLNPIPASLFSAPDRYFGVKVGSDAETSPRQKIASTAYAQAAGTAGNGVPTGGIIMWSGAAAAVPSGWTLCDGTNGTPDLRDRFVVGAGTAYGGVGASGGASSVTLTVAQLPPHTHGVNDPGHSHTINDPGHSHQSWHNTPSSTQVAIVTDAFGINTGNRSDSATCPAFTGITINGATTGISIQNTGGGQPVDIRPPYYALCFIMKAAN